MLLDMFMAFGSYRADKAQAKAQRAMKEYRNKMTNIANAINQNAITQNTTLQVQQSAKQAVFMRRDELSVAGSTVVAAGAAGVRGRSVNATLLDVQRSAGMQEKQRADDLQNYFVQETQQRLSSSLSAVQNQDLSYIPKPRLSTYLLGAVAKNIDKAVGMFGVPSDTAGGVEGTKQKGTYSPGGESRTAGSAGYAGVRSRF